MELIKQLFPQLENIPKDQRFHVVLAHKNLYSIPRAYISVGKYVSVMDLSNNYISNVSFLRDFRHLEVAVLDHNRITSATTFPKLIKLKTLWLNHNEIDKLVEFLINLSRSCPKLEVLSLLGNKGVATFKNTSNSNEILVYRYYVISEFPNLIYLDDAPVTLEERTQANKMFPKRTILESFRVVGSELAHMISSKPRDNRVV